MHITTSCILSIRHIISYIFNKIFYKHFNRVTAKKKKQNQLHLNIIYTLLLPKIFNYTKPNHFNEDGFYFMIKVCSKI